jgi:CRP/FNR family transcriptional regulator
MANKRSEVRTVAEDDTTVVAIPMEYVDRWMTRYPVWKNFVMKAYDDRMFELIKTLDSIAFKNMDERLWEYLETRSRAQTNGILNITHQEIATDLFASREAISRLLKKLEQDGRISLGRNVIHILNPLEKTTR